MDLHLAGKTAVVTGACMGIGRAIAKGLAAEGVQVAAMARRTPLLEEFAGEIERDRGVRPPVVDFPRHHGAERGNEAARRCACRARSCRYSGQLRRRHPDPRLTVWDSVDLGWKSLILFCSDGVVSFTRGVRGNRDGGSTGF